MKPKNTGTTNKVSVREKNAMEQLQKVLSKHEESIIEDIKQKAVKATMDAIKPLLDKLEEANNQQKQQLSQQQQQAQNPAVLSYEDQIKNMQVLANEKLKMQELKIQQKMQSLQTKITKRVL